MTKRDDGYRWDCPVCQASNFNATADNGVLQCPTCGRVVHVPPEVVEPEAVTPEPPPVEPVKPTPIKDAPAVVQGETPPVAQAFADIFGGK